MEAVVGSGTEEKGEVITDDETVFEKIPLLVRAAASTCAMVRPAYCPVIISKKLAVLPSFESVTIPNTSILTVVLTLAGGGAGLLD